jgi:hypothetical protein
MLRTAATEQRLGPPPLVGGARGGGRKLSPQYLQHTVQVSENLMVPESQNLKTFAHQPCIPLPVLILFDSMLSPIDFYDNFPLKTYKIHDVGTERPLTTKLQTADLLSAQLRP